MAKEHWGGGGRCLMRHRKRSYQRYGIEGESRRDQGGALMNEPLAGFLLQKKPSSKDGINQALRPESMWIVGYYLEDAAKRCDREP